MGLLQAVLHLGLRNLAEARCNRKPPAPDQPERARGPGPGHWRRALAGAEAGLKQAANSRGRHSLASPPPAPAPTLRLGSSRAFPSICRATAESKTGQTPPQGASSSGRHGAGFEGCQVAQGCLLPGNQHASGAERLAGRKPAQPHARVRLYSRDRNRKEIADRPAAGITAISRLASVYGRAVPSRSRESCGGESSSSQKAYPQHRNPAFPLQPGRGASSKQGAPGAEPG